MADNRELFGSGTESEQEEEQHHEENEEQEEEEEHQGEHEGEEEEHGEGDEEQQEEENDEEKQDEEHENEEQEENDDDDDDDVVRRKAPKATEVFGDELADLSEDEDKQSDDDHHEISGSQSRHLIQDDDEETEPEQVISIEIPKVKTDLGKEIHFVKLPNFLSVEPKPFDPETYEDENPNGETLDEEGKTRVRLKVENTIRWRYEKDADGNLAKQSNARIVKWSDGSMSLYLGNEIFDVYKTFMQGDHNHLFVRQNNVLHGQTVFRTKLTFRPHSTDSMTHRKMTMSLVDRGAKTKKVKILTELKKNPEFKRQELMKKEEEKLKAASRRQNQQRRIREKSHSKGITSNYLEDKYHSEEEEMSLNAIKNKFKFRADNRNFSSSDESDKERRSSKSKKNLDDLDEYDEDDDYDDDDDDELNRSKKSNSGSQKNKKKKKVVLDDEDE